jgi:hypothetical protein
MGGCGWIHPARDAGKWQAVVDTIMNLLFHKMLEIS